MTFHGKVEAHAKGLTVNGEKLEGWMDAMTITYPVDKPEVLKKVKVGDTIMATVYRGDITLDDVQVYAAQQGGRPEAEMTDDGRSQCSHIAPHPGDLVFIG
jgi:Cu/Ag efflux protein CusF